MDVQLYACRNGVFNKRESAMTELTDSESTPLLQAIPRPVVSAALRTLPDAGSDTVDQREVVLVLRVFCERKTYQSGNTSLQYWVADRATIESTPF
jgi:hypothetical protein